jgi:hypothetical protein
MGKQAVEHLLKQKLEQTASTEASKWTSKNRPPVPVPLSTYLMLPPVDRRTARPRARGAETAAATAANSDDLPDEVTEAPGVVG